MSHDAHDTWESYRPFLEILARSRIPADCRGTIDSSSAVQETLANVERREDSAELETDDQKRVYLRQTLFDVLDDRMTARSLTVRSPGLRTDFVDETIPVRHLVRDGLLDRLAEALGSLAPGERETVEAQFLDKAAPDEIAERLGRPTEAVVGLIRRGIETLRQRLLGPPEPGRAPNSGKLPRVPQSLCQLTSGSTVYP